MSDGSVTDEIAHRWLQEIADAAFISLHFDTPGLGPSEISGGGYLRTKVAFSQPTNRAIWSLSDARFTGLVQNQLTHFGVWDAKNNGILMAYAALPVRETILNGQGYIISEGDLAISIG